MRKVLVGMFLGFLFLAFGSHTSYAEMCGCMDKMAEGMHGKGMHDMEGMRHRSTAMMGGEHRMWSHLKDLGLDDKQKEAIKEIKSRAAKDTVRKKADLQVARIELKDILTKDPVDMKAVEAKLKQTESLRTDLHLSHIKAMEEVKAKLTPEQREKFKRHFDKHQRGERGRKRMTPPHGEEG